MPGERNSMRRVPRGVAAVIAPWNFPLAIPTGMTSAALAAGNAVVLKPAEQSPASASMLVEALHDAGVPPDALALLPGYGEAGAALVRDPRVHLIAFTGSSQVGLEIIRTAADTPNGQGHVKRVIAEMGGKNCAIVDSDADLDDAIPSIVASAFGYAGQKCSATARVLAHEAIADALLERLAGAADTLVVGQAEGFATDVPPVIEREARKRIDDYRELAAAEGRLLTAAREMPGDGLVLPARGRRGRGLGRRCCATRSSGRCSRSRRSPASRRPGDRRRAAGRAHRRALLAQPADDRPVRERTPVGNLYVNRPPPGRWSAGSRSAAIGAPGSARRRAGRTTCSSSPSPAWSARTRCATASRPRAAPPDKCDDPALAGRSNATTPLSPGLSAAQMRRPRFRGVV